jgi:hypothetical protein
MTFVGSEHDLHTNVENGDIFGTRDLLRNKIRSLSPAHFDK